MIGEWSIEQWNETLSDVSNFCVLSPLLFPAHNEDNGDSTYFFYVHEGANKQCDLILPWGFFHTTVSSQESVCNLSQS